MMKAKSVSVISKASTTFDATLKEHQAKFSQDSVSAVDETEVELPISPMEFDMFIPWAYKKFTGSSVVITRKIQDRYVEISEKKPAKLKRNKHYADRFIDNIDESLAFGTESSLEENSKEVQVTAFYNDNYKLVEISIIGSTVMVPREIIRVISLSVPYHSSLKRFTFRRSRLNAGLIYEINKLLPLSNICEIILDDSYVPEGNYNILLEQFSQLKYLSLNRCNINDEVCKKILKNISSDAPAANTLQILELGSNDITDDAAKFMGCVLRTNRCLLHLNISGNKITDNGFVKILESLMEFPLDFEEKSATMRKNMRYFQAKTAVYARCLNDLKLANVDDVTIDNVCIGTTPSKKMILKRLRARGKKSEELRSVEEEAEMMATTIVGEFYDPFSPNRVVFKNGLTYAKGNFVLCSINIAYNELEFASVQKLREVLQHQYLMQMSVKDTGLIRVILDGNKIPPTCPELFDIDNYLNNVVNLRRALEAKKRTKTLSRKKSSHYQGLRQNYFSQTDI